MSLNSQYELTNMILFAHTPELKAPAKMVLTLLSGFGDAAGNNIYPSLKTIAKLSGMTTRSAQDNINKLVELGYISKVSGGFDSETGQNVNSQYKLRLEKLGLEMPENVVPVDFGKQEMPPADPRFMPKDVADRLKQG